MNDLDGEACMRFGCIILIIICIICLPFWVMDNETRLEKEYQEKNTTILLEGKLTRKYRKSEIGEDSYCFEINGNTEYIVKSYYERNKLITSEEEYYYGIPIGSHLKIYESHRIEVL